MTENNSLQIDKASGLLKNCRYCPSPNHGERPHDSTVRLIVIHSISLPPGQYGGDYIEAFFTNRLDTNMHPYFRAIEQLKVSAHVLIRRDGEIVQFVPFHKRAWHAGQSTYQNTPRCNDFSIGIELEGTDCDHFEDVQYDQLNRLIHSLRTLYPDIKETDITGHSDIAPGRKTDPGSGFDWSRIQTQAI